MLHDGINLSVTESTPGRFVAGFLQIWSAFQILNRPATLDDETRGIRRKRSLTVRLRENPSLHLWAFIGPFFVIIMSNFTLTQQVDMSEWLRRQTWNLLGFARAGSNPAVDEIFCNINQNCNLQNYPLPLIFFFDNEERQASILGLHNPKTS